VGSRILDMKVAGTQEDVLAIDLGMKEEVGTEWVEGQRLADPAHNSSRSCPEGPVRLHTVHSSRDDNLCLERCFPFQFRSHFGQTWFGTPGVFHQYRLQLRHRTFIYLPFTGTMLMKQAIDIVVVWLFVFKSDVLPRTSTEYVEQYL
jgi:hypothetical protein